MKALVVLEAFICWVMSSLIMYKPCFLFVCFFLNFFLFTCLWPCSLVLLNSMFLSWKMYAPCFCCQLIFFVFSFCCRLHVETTLIHVIFVPNILSVLRPMIGTVTR
jgi:hypothetical protein